MRCDWCGIGRSRFGDETLPVSPDVEPYDVEVLADEIRVRRVLEVLLVHLVAVRAAVHPRENVSPESPWCRLSQLYSR